MCGIVGFLGRNRHGDGAGFTTLLEKMAFAIQSRGPDDFGSWADERHAIGLGHRRLSIIDLSPAGHQPMPSASGRYQIAYNGEVYNHLDIRAELEAAGLAPAWRGHSDTETLLAGFDAWGIEATVRKAIGMFAFGVWDQQTHVLTLGRDRLGEKPLYYGWQGKGADAAFLFGSELKALREHPQFRGCVSRAALTLYCRSNYIPAPYSIYEGIYKLLPGALLEISHDRPDPKIWQYWSVAGAVATGKANPFAGTAEQAVDELDRLLKDAVRQQMVADVPLGAFLSGGVDSSTIVALMQVQSKRPVKTFTIGFNEARFNEAEHAKAVARHLGTEHSELYVTSEQARNVIPGLPQLYDEPFADSSQIPTFLVSQLARQHVTVALSGDGGDELFCGYQRYSLAAAIWRRVAMAPRPLRKAVALGLAGIPVSSWNVMAGLASPVLPARLRGLNWGDKIHKGAALVSSTSASDLYGSLLTLWRDPASMVIGGAVPPAWLDEELPAVGEVDDMSRMMAWDMLSYLPDDILTKVDRAAMGVSLETRVPMLDHRVLEFAWRMPQAMKVRDSQAKWPLRQVLYRYVPKDLIERPKMGFAVPIGEWLRGPLKAWAEELLSESRLERDGYFHVGLVRQKWNEHQSGLRNWEHHLWNVLMFNAWADHWLN